MILTIASYYAVIATTVAIMFLATWDYYSLEAPPVGAFDKLLIAITTGAIWPIFLVYLILSD